MSEERLPEVKPLYADKKAALKALEQVYQEIGFEPDHSGTIQELHEQMIMEGVWPEDNGASREIITLRYPNGN